MSRVYRANDNETGRTVCLKVQFPDKQAAAEARADRPPDRGRDRHEGRPPQRGPHPGTRDLDQGGPVHRDGVHRRREPQIRPRGDHGRGPSKVDLLAQAAEGLAAVHAAGFIHHDVGPKNFLVDRENRVKLIDFGLAVPNTPAFHRPGNRTGMLQYMAPELIRRERPTSGSTSSASA